MDEDEPIGILLSQHMLCTVHTLDLVATTDADKALDKDGIYKKHHRLAFGKAQASWNKQSRHGNGLSCLSTTHENIFRRVIVIYWYLRIIIHAVELMTKKIYSKKAIKLIGTKDCYQFCAKYCIAKSSSQSA